MIDHVWKKMYQNQQASEQVLIQIQQQYRQKKKKIESFQQKIDQIIKDQKSKQQDKHFHARFLMKQIRLVVIRFDPRIRGLLKRCYKTYINQYFDEKYKKVCRYFAVNVPSWDDKFSKQDQIKWKKQLNYQALPFQSEYKARVDRIFQIQQKIKAIQIMMFPVLQDTQRQFKIRYLQSLIHWQTCIIQCSI